MVVAWFSFGSFARKTIPFGPISKLKNVSIDFVESRGCQLLVCAAERWYWRLESSSLESIDWLAQCVTGRTIAICAVAGAGQGSVPDAVSLRCKPCL